MSEVVSAFVRREAVEKVADAHPKVVDRALGRLSQQALELGEGEFDSWRDP